MEDKEVSPLYLPLGEQSRVHPAVLEIVSRDITLEAHPNGGKVKLFLRNWQALTQDPSILNLVRGWRIPFLRKPHQSRIPNEIPLNALETAAVDIEIENMLQKGAICKSKMEENQYISGIFVRPKKDGRFRPIINLKHLNKDIEYVHFKMDNLSDIKHLLKKGDVMTKLDLADAYWSVGIHPESQKYLKFLWKGNLYQFMVLAFGLGPAPRLFTKLLKVPISILRRLNIRIIIYLDDMLIISSSVQEALKDRDTVITLLLSLGLTINWDKSCLTPSLCLEFLGMIISSRDLTIALPKEKAKELRKLCRSLRKEGSTTLRKLAKVIGKLYATSPAVSIAPVQLRGLQHDLIVSQNQGQGYEDIVILSKEALADLKWWLRNLKLIRGNPLTMEPPEIFLSSDASKTVGWGAHMKGGRSIGGAWSQKEREQSMSTSMSWN